MLSSRLRHLNGVAPRQAQRGVAPSHGVKPRKGHTGEDWPKEAHNWLRISPLHETARKGDVRKAKTPLGVLRLRIPRRVAMGEAQADDITCVIVKVSEVVQPHVS